MNNKSFYAILCFVSFIGMWGVLHHPYSLIPDILLCGGALYYAAHRYKVRRRVNVMMVLMVIMAILVNPVYPLPLDKPYRVPIYLVAAILFYLAARGEVIVMGQDVSKKMSEEERKEIND